MYDIGNISYFIGVKFYKCGRELIIHQIIYDSEILKRYDIEDYNFASTPTKPRVKFTKDSDECDIDPTLYSSSGHWDNFVTQGQT